jgi:hypothetical protein
MVTGNREREEGERKRFSHLFRSVANGLLLLLLLLSQVNNISSFLGLTISSSS